MRGRGVNVLQKLRVPLVLALSVAAFSGTAQAAGTSVYVTSRCGDIGATIITHQGPAIRPASFPLHCGGTLEAVISGVSYRSYGAKQAIGSGTVDFQGCSAACSNGHVHERATFTLTNIERCSDGRLYYSTIHLNAPGVPSSAIDSLLPNLSCSRVLTAPQPKRGAPGGTGPQQWADEAASDPPGSMGSQLTSISCVTAQDCIAVGYTDTSGQGDDVPLAESWNGSAWHILATPSPDGYSNRLLGVSCPTAGWCVAVGVSLQGYQGYPLVETWSGGGWSVTSTPQAPTGAFGSEGDVLSGVSCVSPTACVAVGYVTGDAAGAGVGDNPTPLSEIWNGTGWSIVTPPTPANDTSDLSSVSCLSVSSCVAVGGDGVDFSGASAPLAEAWNGATWTIQPTAGSTGLPTVSCVLPGACETVGNGLTLGWTGSAWSAQTVPPASDGTSVSLASVSCPAATRCLAVGEDGNSVLQGYSWNGTSWAVQGDAAAAGGATLSSASSAAFESVSCALPTACMAVGAVTPAMSQGGSQPLAERWTGVIGTTPAGPVPVLHTSVLLTLKGGTVTYRLPGKTAAHALSGSALVPVGADVDALAGTVLVTVASGGSPAERGATLHSGEFVIDQDAAPPYETHFVLSQPLIGCSAQGASAARARHTTERHLWAGDNGGSFGTTGRYVSTAVEGTQWLTADTCSSSSVDVTQGVVAVTDLITHRTVVVRAGQHYSTAKPTAHHSQPPPQPPPPPGPLAVTNAYWSAVAARQYARAYGYLVPGAIPQSQAQFTAMERSYGIESVAYRGRLSSRSASTASVAVVSLVTRDHRFGCRQWSGSYQLDDRGGNWLIAQANVTARACRG